MARQAEKQLAKNNATKIAGMRKIAACINLAFILIRLVWQYGSTNKKTFALYFLTNIVAIGVQLQLERIGKPCFAPDGTLLSPGDDLSQAGVTEYLFDFIYLTWIVFALVAAVTDYAWTLYLLIPCYAVVKIWPYIRSVVSARTSANADGRMSSSATDPAASGQDTLSKRQQKLKTRQEKYSQIRAR
ncbi:hypothetical protein PYCC9005_003546 [Savitreella phatthalungensis]